MRAITKIVPKTEEELVKIECHEVNDTVTEIVKFVDSRAEAIEGYDNDKAYRILIKDIFYIEAVDNRVYAYLEDKILELKIKLYEFEEQYGNEEFFRCSKNTIVNLMKIDYMKPALNGRFLAALYNGESIIISRKYAVELKRRLK